MTTKEHSGKSAADCVPRPQAAGAGKVIMWGAIGVLLYVAHTAFVPVFLALLLALVLSGPVEFLHTKRVPRQVSALAIVVLVLFGFAVPTSMMWKPAQDWLARAPQTMALVRQKVNPVARAIDRLDVLRINAGTIGVPGQPISSGASAPATSSQSAPALIVNVGSAAIASVLAFVIVTVFLLVGGPPMVARMTAAFVDNWQASSVQNMLEEVRAELSRFYIVTTLINLALGIATGIAMWAWGMPTPYLWGALAAVLNYIPYLGAGTTLLLISLVAVVSFDTLSQVLGVAGSFVVLATIEGQVAQPLLVGRRLKVNPLLIFLGLWFGGMFWGIAGIILATPMLVALKVFAENTKSGKPLMEFLGPNDQRPNQDAKLKNFARRMAKPNAVKSR
jgi:predicted PurR-regulated permease PerM